MIRDVVHFNAPNGIGKKLVVRDKAVKQDKYFIKVVKDCLVALHKNGVTHCFDTEQLKDIQCKCDFEIDYNDRDFPIRIWRV